MKNFSKLFSLLVIVAALVTAPIVSQAQVYTLPLAAGDTVSNTGTINKDFGISGNYKGVVVSPSYAKISGTVAGTIKLQASLDGSNYTDVASQTFSATDVAANRTLWYITAPLARYYRVTWTGTGTMSAVLTVRYRPNL